MPPNTPRSIDRSKQVAFYLQIDKRTYVSIPSSPSGVVCPKRGSTTPPLHPNPHPPPHTHTVTDISGASNFILVAWLTFCLGPASEYTRPLVNTLLVTVWGVRLGGYLLKRVLQRGHDARFDEARGTKKQQ
jgi:hypothetical protein